MRIALVAAGGFDRSGRERVIPALLSLIERLARRHDVAVYVLRYHERPCAYDLLGATVHDLGRPEGIRRQLHALVQGLRRDGPFDVLHGYLVLPAGLVTVLAGRRLGIPTVVTADSGEFVSLPDIDYGLQRQWRHRLAVKVTTRCAARLTVCSTYMQHLARRFGCNPHVIPLGVDCTTFHPAAGDGGLGEPGPPWRLLHVASLNRVKDQPRLLHAFRRVVDAVAPAEVRLDIVGEDTLGGSIQELARTLAVDSHVTFHGSLPTEALVRHYQRAHALIVTSRHEAASVVALEAAATCVPVVGTAVGYLADWSPHGAATTTGSTAEDLAHAITTLLKEPRRRRAMAAAAQRWALTHDADWTSTQFEHLYETVQRPHR